MKSEIVGAYTLAQCMDAMAEYTWECESRGEKNIVFCEDRLTLMAERALLKRSGGTFLTSVTTFARFLKTDAKVLSKQGAVMATGSAMTALNREKKLRCFTSAESIKNGARSVYETLAQLAASEVGEDTLKESAAMLPDGNLKDKVYDLAEIYVAYRNFLRENGYVDESGYLSLLPKYIRESGRLCGVNVVFLCYGSFTAQAAEIIRACLQTAGSVVGIFCGGKEDIYTERARRVYMRVCGEENCAVRIRNAGVPLVGEAEVLRQGLFNPERLTSRRMQTDKIRIFEAQDKNDEAEFVAANVKKMLAENPSAQYRDFAVLTSDTAGYVMPLKKAFDEYGIPFFLDVKKSLKQHPFGRFLLDAFAVVKERFSPRSVQSLTQNPFFGESDEYRNYLLKFANYRGGAKREIKQGKIVEDYDVAKLEEARARLLLVTKNLITKGHGRDYCRAIREILKNFRAEEKLKELEERVEDVTLKSYLSQIFPAVERILTEAELLAGDKELTVAEFEAILSGGLEATEISIIPLKTDAVFVGDITDSKIGSVEYLFAVGMTDAVPRSTDDTALISDREIELLADVKTCLEPTVAEVNLRSRESVGLNLCAFRDRLYFSYPLNANGEEPALSEIFRYVNGLFCRAGNGNILTEKELPEEDFKYACSEVVPAIRRLLIEKHDYENHIKNTAVRYASLREALKRADVREQDAYLERQWGQVRIQKGEELFFKDGKVSPTALEKYFACPFGNFASQGLRLRDREETSVLVTDSGNFIHAMLEESSKKFEEIETEEEMRVFAEATGRALLQEPVYASMADTSAGGYAAENMLGEGVAACVAAFLQVKNSDYRVEATEKKVSGENFRGKVDRVDATDDYVRIIDYKTGRIDDKAVSYYTGRKMQLQLYMSAVKGDRIPTGVFYFPASVSYKKPDEENFRMLGFLNGERDAVQAGDKKLAEGEKSRYFDARLGDNSRLEKAMDQEVFSDFLDYAVYEARQGARELRGGFIAPSPYEKGCEYCSYGGMCGFNYDLAPSRKEQTITPKEIANIVKRHREGLDGQSVTAEEQRREEETKRGKVEPEGTEE